LILGENIGHEDFYTVTSWSVISVFCLGCDETNFVTPELFCTIPSLFSGTKQLKEKNKEKKKKKSCQLPVIPSSHMNTGADPRSETDGETKVSKCV
jgi:hypothetical protein